MKNESFLKAVFGKLLGNKGYERFNITAASEVMAILCMSEDFEDLKAKLQD